MEVWTNNNPNIFIDKTKLNDAESTFEEVSRSGKAIYYTMRTAPARNTCVLVEPMENIHINMDWYPKLILGNYDTIPQYYAACLLHTLDVLGYVSADTVGRVKQMLKLSKKQEKIIWK